jgi:hypothetical protein
MEVVLCSVLVGSVSAYLSRFEMHPLLASHGLNILILYLWGFLLT